MKYEWLNKKNGNNRLIIFFNGWGMNESVVRHLEPEDYNILMFNDYRNLDTDFEWEGNYNEINLIAWSMGVMIADIVLQQILPQEVKLNRKTAINGTLKPVDEKFGINPRVYDLMIRNFSDKTCEKFVHNMFNGDISRNVAIDFPIESLKSELIALKQYRAQGNFKYDSVLISDDDRIIPTKNQCAYWKRESNVSGGHCLFLGFRKWGELI